MLRLQRELAALAEDDTELSRVASIAEDRERLVREIEAAERSLTGTVAGKVKYPRNLTYANFLDYMFCPTLIYELEYPRTDRYSTRVCSYRIRIAYILEKTAATLGSIGLMIVITEQYVLPAIQPILPDRTFGMPFSQKLVELGWVLLDMMFPYAHNR
jgi:sterol O-acyltransferase